MSRLKQVFFILLDNAIRYTPQGEIRIRLSREAAKITFSIQDTGVGITAIDRERLFTKFGHGRDSAKTNPSSSGLGLYLAAQFVRAHGGDISVQSPGADRGSIFTATLKV
jgi:signal transduction histidine kinase